MEGREVWRETGRGYGAVPHYKKFHQALYINRLEFDHGDFELKTQSAFPT